MEAPSALFRGWPTNWLRSDMTLSCSRAAIRKPRPTWRRVGRRHCVWTARSATRMRCISPCSSEFANGLMISICCTFISDYYPFSLFSRQPTPFVTTLHGRLDLPEHQVVFAAFPSIPVISISDAQRRPLAGAGWIHHGLPERLLTPQPDGPAYFAFLGRISADR